MLAVLESKNFPLLGKAMEQLKEDFIQVSPNGVISEDPDLSKILLRKVNNENPTLVILKEPYRLIDCMTSTTIKSRDFVYQVIDYLHQENRHLAISLMNIGIMNRRLRNLTNSRITLRPSRFRVVSLANGQTKTGILGKDNLWKIIIAPPETLPKDNLEPEDNLDKILVTIESQSGREDYLVKPNEPFIMKNGEVLTITPPDNPDIL